MNTREIWPYPKFDTNGRQAEVMAALTKGCPAVEFVPVTVESGPDVSKALDLKEKVDGFLIYVMTLVWSQGPTIVQIDRPVGQTDAGRRRVPGRLGGVSDQL